MSEIFALRQMWNNLLCKLWNLMLSHQVKWNKSLMRRSAFHIAKQYFTCEAYFTNPIKDLFRWKRPMLCIKASVFFWRRRRDLNPRDSYPPYALSRGASSASWVLLHRPTNMNLWLWFHNEGIIAQGFAIVNGRIDDSSAEKGRDISRPMFYSFSKKSINLGSHQSR